VVVFCREIPTTNSAPATLEVAVRHEAVGSHEAATSSAVTAMFRVALATVATALLASMAIIAWMIRREVRRQAQRQREEHLAFSGVLANGIAHDFRNPMSSLRLDVQMLEKEVSQENGMRRDRVVTLASRIRGTMDRMDKVFQEFLYLSRPADDGREPADLRVLVRECLDIMAPRFEHAGVVPTVDMQDAPVPVSVHPASLKRAIINVLTNAEQFAGSNGAVHVSLAVAGDHGRIEVSDSGPGIPVADRKRVFDMFFTRRPEGTGLGLYLAKSAIERSGGTIEATNASSGGACIRIVLPLASVSSTPSDAAPSSSSATGE
jgi:signal transduction histidine kinase